MADSSTPLRAAPDLSVPAKDAAMVDPEASSFESQLVARQALAHGPAAPGSGIGWKEREGR